MSGGKPIPGSNDPGCTPQQRGSSHDPQHVGECNNGAGQSGQPLLHTGTVQRGKWSRDH